MKNSLWDPPPFSPFYPVIYNRLQVHLLTVFCLQFELPWGRKWFQFSTLGTKDQVFVFKPLQSAK